MDLQRWKQIDNLFSEALQLDPDKRSLFLEEVCKGDTNLKSEVEALLSLDNHPDSSIEGSPGRVALDMLAERKDRFSPGESIGPYKIISVLGAGGMGEVYKALDLRLKREVAIKVLPSEYSDNKDRLYRFEQESRSAGLLNHPNILTIYDVGTDEGCHYLVSELLEGQTFRKLLNAPLPSHKVVEYMLQVANGLAAAHQKGIIHRDLKLENLFLTKDNRVKILDFGLAKLLYQDGEGSASSRVSSATSPFQVLGTAGYMSPEQVQAQPIDQRADIFAFGVVLYEMLFDKPAFLRKTWIQSLNAIVSEDPPEFSDTNLKVPPALVRITRRCLEKDPDRRFQSATDLAFAMENMTSDTLPLIKPLNVRKKQQAWIGAMIFFFLTTLIGGVALFRSLNRSALESPSSVQRLSIVLPENTALNSLAISPDGQRLAYVTNGTTGFSTLWLRSMDSTQAQEITETEEATLPFWSPDSKSIGFFTEQELKTVTIGGGPPKTLYEGTVIPKGGTWNQFGDILFSPLGGNGLYRISERGGEATPATTLDRSLGEARHTFPQFLPDGRHFFYLVRSNRAENKVVYIGTLDSKDRKLILPESTPVRFVEPGYLFFVRNNKLMVQQFDKNSFKLTGNPIQIADNGSSYVSGPDFSVSENNILVYGGVGGGWSTQPIWFDRSGRQSSPSKNYPSALREPGDYWFCDLSSDDKRLLIGSGGVMWIVDLSLGSFTRYAMTDETDAVFSPDGSEVAYAALFQGNDSTLYRRASSGTGKAELLYKPSFPIADLDWAADGRFITFTNYFQLWALPLQGDRIPFQYLRTEGRQESAVLSPDGKWFAYQSYKTGRPEVYVRSFHVEAGGLWAISTDGGEKPIWRRDGKELFYLTPDRKLMATEVQTGETFKQGATRFLFQTHTQPRINTWGIGAGKLYFASSDGQHFLVNTLIDNTTPTEINVVSNWKSLLKK